MSLSRASTIALSDRVISPVRRKWPAPGMRLSRAVPERLTAAGRATGILSVSVPLVAVMAVLRLLMPTMAEPPAMLSESVPGGVLSVMGLTLSARKASWRCRR